MKIVYRLEYRVPSNEAEGEYLRTVGIFADHLVASYFCALMNDLPGTKAGDKYDIPRDAEFHVYSETVDETQPDQNVDKVLSQILNTHFRSGV